MAPKQRQEESPTPSFDVDDDDDDSLFGSEDDEDSEITPQASEDGGATPRLPGPSSVKPAAAAATAKDPAATTAAAASALNKAAPSKPSTGTASPLQEASSGMTFSMSDELTASDDLRPSDPGKPAAGTSAAPVAKAAQPSSAPAPSRPAPSTAATPTKSVPVASASATPSTLTLTGDYSLSTTGLSGDIDDDVYPTTVVADDGKRGQATPAATAAAPVAPPASSNATPPATGRATPAVAQPGKETSTNSSIPAQAPTATPQSPQGAVPVTPSKAGPGAAQHSTASQNALPAKPSIMPSEVAGLSAVDQATGLDLPTPLQLFMQYDTDGSRAVGRDEFKRMLVDLDGLLGVDKKEVDRYTNAEFEKADLNHDGILSIDEFYYYFYRELCFKFPVLRTGVNPGADLFNIFTKYCSAGKPTRCVEMYSHQFSKLVKDAKLLCNTINKADVDILFSRARAETEVLDVHQQKPGAKWTTASITYPQFLFALLRLAEKRRTGLQEVMSRIMANVSAVPKPSQADLLIFHNTGDPQQLAEWVLRPRGLPQLPRVANDSAERMQREAALAQHLKLPSHAKNTKAGAPPWQQAKPGEAAAPAAAPAAQPTPSAPAAPAATPAAAGAQQPPSPQAAPRGDGNAQDVLPEVREYLASTTKRKQWGLEDYGSPESLGLPCLGKAALASPAALLAVRKLDPDHMMMALKRTFERYNLWERGVNKAAMDKVRFVKSLRDAGLVCEAGPLTNAAADAVFYKVLAPAKAHLNFIEYIEALRHVATRMRLSLNEIMERIILISAPLGS